MNEIELKFLVPTNKLTAIKRQTHIKASIENQLSAHYFDTPNRQLAKNGIAIRIRQEIKDLKNNTPSEHSASELSPSEQWVQTFKTSGDGIASRLEHNHLLDNEQAKANFLEGSLRPHLSVYTKTPISKVFQELSNKEDSTQLQKELTLLYSTDVHRVTRLINKKEGDNHHTIEVAYDTGEVNHLTETGEKRSQPIHEIEFEILKGDIQFLFETVKIWCKRYNLCLSTVTKAERGGLVMANQSHPKAGRANLKHYRQNLFTKKTSQPEFLRSVVHNCLLQILPNASAIVGGSIEAHANDINTDTANDHVHQLRVGIRRLRTALKFFAGFSEQVNPEWLTILKETFSTLGEYRDREVLITKTQPMLEQMGSPHVDWTDNLINVQTASIEAVKANDFQLTLLELIEFAMSDSKTESNQKPAKPLLTKTLNKLFGKICTASNHFATLEIEAQHDVRKHLKALRYISEFASPLYDTSKKKADKLEKKKSKNIAKKVDKKAGKNALSHKDADTQSQNHQKIQYKQFIKSLKPAQEVLGDYNDNFVGHECYIEKAKTNPNAYFAVGWFLAQEKMSAMVCAHNLKTVSSVPVFWR